MLNLNHSESIHYKPNSVKYECLKNIRFKHIAILNMARCILLKKNDKQSDFEMPGHFKY